MDGSALEEKTSFTMLGLTFSSKLDWASYIISIAKTASKKTGALKLDPQGFVLGNDLNQAIKFCKVYHFADDTNLLCLSNSIKTLNKLVNTDLKHLINWLNANKISLNVKKTEMIIFKSNQKKLEGDLKIKLCGKRLYPTETVKYLGIKIDITLSWEYHVNDLSIKLNRANVLLFKMRKYVSLKI